ncbi:MAG: DUF4325 domain-containing protein [Patescibacteria group bacterium]
MNKRQKILSTIMKSGRVTSAKIAERFGVSRQYATMVIADLVAKGDLVKVGKTRSAFYVSRPYMAAHPDVVPREFRKRYRNRALEEHVVLREAEDALPTFRELTENVRSIFTYAFSEMVNNAIEHSKSTYISISAMISDADLTFTVSDHGVGAFRNVMRQRKLPSEIAAAQDLLKGKTTTAPKLHSGEGIFFTSKAGDSFVLDSFGLALVVDAETGADITRAESITRGTRVRFRIATHSRRHLNNVFKKYTNLTDDSDYGFDKTEIRVQLFTTGGVHISRSQARRILEGLEKFKVILFDYERVPLVGQAFADEIYRVFHRRHPGIRLENTNMNPSVRFMVERAQHEAEKKG